MVVCLIPFAIILPILWVILRFTLFDTNKLHRWARSQQLTILHSERRAWFQQPFRGVDDEDAAFFIRVRTPTGQIREGFIVFRRGINLSLSGHPIPHTELQWLPPPPPPPQNPPLPPVPNS